MNKWIAISISSVLAVAVIAPGVLYAREAGRLRDAQDEIVTLGGNVSTLEADLAVAESQALSLEVDLAAPETEVSALEVDLAIAESEVSSLEVNLAASKARVSGLEVNLVAAEAEVPALEGDLTAAEAEVSTLETDLAAAESIIAALEAELVAAGGGEETGIPGGSLADPILYDDVLALIMILEFSCTNPVVINIEVTEILADGRWGERWTLDSCGVTVAYDIWFVPDGQGGTFFSVIRV